MSNRSSSWLTTLVELSTVAALGPGCGIVFEVFRNAALTGGFTQVDVLLLGLGVVGIGVGTWQLANRLTATSESPRIKAPWSAVSWFSRTFISTYYQEHVFDSLIGQFHEDYCKALAENRPWRARLLCVYLYINAVGATCGIITGSAVKAIVAVWKLIA